MAVCVAFAEILHLLREKKEGVEGELEEGGGGEGDVLKNK